MVNSNQFYYISECRIKEIDDLNVKIGNGNGNGNGNENKFIQFIDENKYPFTKQQVFDYLSKYIPKNRLGWYYQQLLKLYIFRLCTNDNEIKLKKLQGCTTIFLSRLFKTNYKNKNGHLGIIKYNLFPYTESLSALGGINKNNFNQLRNIKSDSFALSSAFIEDNSINKLFY